MTRSVGTHNHSRGVAVLMCLLLLSGDCGSVQDGGSTSRRTDPITATVGGSDPVEFEVNVRMTAAEPVNTGGVLVLMAIAATPTPKVDVLVVLECPRNQPLVPANLAEPDVPDLTEYLDETAPAEVSCNIVITPQAEVAPPIDVEFVVAAEVEWGYQNRDKDVGIAIEVTPL